MSTQTPGRESKLANLKTSIGAFGLSLIIHTAVLLLVGSMVVFEGVLPKTPFVAVEGVVNAIESETIPDPPEEQIMDLPDTPTLNNDLMIQTESTNDAQETTSSDIIVSSAINSTFTLPLAIGAPTPVPTLGSGIGTGSMGGGGNAASTNPSTAQVVRTLFGTTATDKPVLTGTFYDASRARNGDAIGVATVARFTESTRAWAKDSKGSPRFLRERYWESKNPIYASFIAIPGGDTPIAFASFGEKPVTPNPAYLIHYTARIALPETTTFRFNSFGNDVIIILIDGKVVNVADNAEGTDWQSNPTDKRSKSRFGWESPDPLLFPRAESYNRYTRGDWLTWNANEYHKIDILIGDAAVGGDYYVLIEEKNKKYKTVERTRAFNAHANNEGIPLLPLFRVDRGRIPDEVLSRGFLREVGYEERGPVFLVQPN